MASEIDGKLRWSIGRRLEFIDFRLFWEGRVNRADLVRAFGISLPQASADLSRYQDLAGASIVYDKTAKAYVAGPKFRPVLHDPSAEQYLSQLRSVATGVLGRAQTWLGRLPSLAIVAPLPRPLPPDTLRQVLQALRNRSALRIHYQSFSRPAPLWRWIAPHALGFDGSRWHARAWCEEHSDFRDFVLARMLTVGETRPTSIDPMLDAEWHHEVTLRLAPHPNMSEAMRRTIALEYGMVRGRLEIKTRVCLSYYLEWQLGLDLDPDATSPYRHHLVLVNREEVKRARLGARAASAYAPEDREPAELAVRVL